MTLHIYRVLVRGRFDRLDGDARACLLAEADEHTVAAAAFTETGTLTYDRALTSFGFRIQVRARGDDSEARAAEQGTDAARAALDRRGVGYRDLRSTTSDMAAVWERQGAGTPGPGRATHRRVVGGPHRRP
ncbi:MAG: hypothetical protein JXA83_02830 [Acidimicrobiales bacterium]|nr:hypothetical protein [Acidimicrobiales bacterium]